MKNTKIYQIPAPTRKSKLTKTARKKAVFSYVYNTPSPYSKKILIFFRKPLDLRINLVYNIAIAYEIDRLY